MSESTFVKSYNSWAKKKGYQSSERKAKQTYALASDGIPTLEWFFIWFYQSNIDHLSLISDLMAENDFIRLNIFCIQHKNWISETMIHAEKNMFHALDGF